MDAKAWDERYAGHELVWSAEPNQFVAAEVDPPPHPGALALAGHPARRTDPRGGPRSGVDAVRMSSTLELFDDDEQRVAVREYGGC